VVRVRDSEEEGSESGIGKRGKDDDGETRRPKQLRQTAFYLVSLFFEY
jgi:hypothetical protein